MRTWARGSGSSPSQQSIRYSLMSNSVSGNPEQECDSNPELWQCELDGITVTPEDYWMDDPFFDPESVSEEDDGGGLYPPQPEDTECHVFYGCGGVGGGVDGEDDEYLGHITIDPTIINNPKAKCVLDKLFDGMTLKNTIVKFADESVDLNLHIELANLDNDTFGDLLSSNQFNTFYLRLNENRIDDRTPIEIAATLLHEAIHAEMRRYLYGATDTSTLPGFPGDFTFDWDYFVNTSFDGNVEAADHELMATRYISIIIEGLKEFGDSNFTHSDYEAIAWLGLEESYFFNDVLSNSEQTTIRDNQNLAKQKANASCN